MKLHERLKLLREETGLSQKEFAEKTKLEVSKYNKWENGKYSPGYDDLCNLAKYFNCTTDYLLGLSNYKNVEEKEELDEFISSIKNILAFLDKDILELTKESIRDYLAVWNPLNISVDRKISIDKAVTISFAIQQIIRTLNSTAGALGVACDKIESSRNLTNGKYCIVNSDYYFIQHHILDAYDMRSRIQRLLLNTFALLIDQPANEIGEILSAEGYNTDFITSDYSASLNRLLEKVARNGRDSNA